MNISKKRSNVKIIMGENIPLNLMSIHPGRVQQKNVWEKCKLSSNKIITHQEGNRWKSDEKEGEHILVDA